MQDKLKIGNEEESNELAEKFQKTKAQKTNRLVRLIYEFCSERQVNKQQGGCGCFSIVQVEVEVQCYDHFITRIVPWDSELQDGDRVDELQEGDEVVDEL